MTDTIDGKKQADDRPFWYTTAGIALFTGILGLSGTLITASYGWFSSHNQQRIEEQLKDRELALAELKEDHTIEKEYFLKAVDSANSAEQRGRVLRYLKISPRVSPEMKGWASQELEQIDVELQAEASTLSASVDDATKALDQTKQQLSKLEPAHDGATKVALAREQREQQELVTRLTLKAATSRKLAAAFAAVESGTAKGRACVVGSVKAVALGPDDPEQKLADAECLSSAAGRQFGGQGTTVWLVRRQGRNFQCECQLR